MIARKRFGLKSGRARLLYRLLLVCESRGVDLVPRRGRVGVGLVPPRQRLRQLRRRRRRCVEVRCGAAYGSSVGLRFTLRAIEFRVIDKPLEVACGIPKYEVLYRELAAYVGFEISSLSLRKKRQDTQGTISMRWPNKISVSMQHERKYLLSYINTHTMRPLRFLT